jgi:hypothetical protein
MFATLIKNMKNNKSNKEEKSKLVFKEFKFSLNHQRNLAMSYSDRKDIGLNKSYEVCVLTKDGIRINSHSFNWDEWNHLISSVEKGKSKLDEIEKHKALVDKANQDLFKVVEEK